MQDTAIFTLVLVAIAIGFWLGRQSKKSKRASMPDQSVYKRGLDFFISNEPDKAVDEFISSLEVNKDTLETHLSLGKLMRKQGQVDRAIRLHQNLLARPILSADHSHQVHLELARDYLAAGLLDRAETLLLEVIEESAVFRSIAQRYLLEIYQDESEWMQAIDVAKSLAQSKFIRSNPKEKRDLSLMISHFYAELAEGAAVRQEFDLAERYLMAALSVEKAVGRVYWLLSRVMLEKQNFKLALKYIVRALDIDPDLAVLSMPYCAEIFSGLYPKQPLKELRSFLESKGFFENDRIVCEYVERLVAEDRDAVRYTAITLLENYLQHSSSSLVASLLLELQVDAADQSDLIAVLIRTLNTLSSKQQSYTCKRCGYKSHVLHWRCPSCKNWEVLKANNDFFKLH